MEHLGRRGQVGPVSVLNGSMTQTDFSGRIRLFFLLCPAEGARVALFSTQVPHQHQMRRNNCHSSKNLSYLIKAVTALKLIDIKRMRCLGKAASIIKDSHHHGHTLIPLLLSARRYRSLNYDHQVQEYLFPKNYLAL